jgi:hypothetical protein
MERHGVVVNIHALCLRVSSFKFLFGERIKRLRFFVVILRSSKKKKKKKKPAQDFNLKETRYSGTVRCILPYIGFEPSIILRTVQSLYRLNHLGSRYTCIERSATHFKNVRSSLRGWDERKKLLYEDTNSCDESM